MSWLTDDLGQTAISILDLMIGVVGIIGGGFTAGRAMAIGRMRVELREALLNADPHPLDSYKDAAAEIRTLATELLPAERSDPEGALATDEGVELKDRLRALKAEIAPLDIKISLLPWTERAGWTHASRPVRRFLYPEDFKAGRGHRRKDKPILYWRHGPIRIDEDMLVEISNLPSGLEDDLRNRRDDFFDIPQSSTSSRTVAAPDRCSLPMEAP